MAGALTETKVTKSGEPSGGEERRSRKYVLKYCKEGSATQGLFPLTHVVTLTIGLGTTY